MAHPKYNKDSIIKTLKNLSKNLKKSELSNSDVKKVLSSSTVRSHFGSVRKAVEAAGLGYNDNSERYKELGKARKIPDEELFKSVLAVEEKLGREPRYSDYQGEGKYSIIPFKRYGSKWTDAILQYRKWKAGKWKPAPKDKTASFIRRTSANISQGRLGESHIFSYSTSKISTDQQNYGEPMEFRGLRHAPINEQGVVFLFGMVSEELGFRVESIQQAFPDCEASYLYNPKRKLWRKARIEFEFRAANFRKACHDEKGCDFIVCWINDWDDCPIEVIELKSIIKKLPG